MNSKNQKHLGYVTPKDDLLYAFDPLSKNTYQIQKSFKQYATLEEADIIAWTNSTDNATQKTKICQLEILAKAKSAKAQVYHIAFNNQLTPFFPPKIMREVDAIIEEPGIQSALDQQTINDLRDLAFITIDNPDSRDLDQAMFLEPIYKNQQKKSCHGYNVYYALADAAYYIKPNSELFKEAQKRGSSFYLPGFSIPMLPAELSEGVISLNQNVDRRALVFKMELKQDGTIQKTTIIRAIIQSRKKLSYAGVQNYYDTPKSVKHPLAKQDFSETLDLLEEIGQKRILLADQKNTPQFLREAPELAYNDQYGSKFELKTDQHLAVENYNAQISILCNLEGAKLLYQVSGKDLQAIFRNQKRPFEQSLKNFHSFTEVLTKTQKLDPQIYLWQRKKSSLASYLEQLPRSGKNLGITKMIHSKAMRLAGGAEFESINRGHFSIGTKEGYARFSSPMREMVGIFTHKELLEGLKLVNPHNIKKDIELQEQVILIGNMAKKKQSMLRKQAYKLAIDDLFKSIHQMEQQKDAQKNTLKHFSGILMGIDRSKAYIRLENPSIDVKIYFKDLEKSQGCSIQVSEMSIYIEAKNEHIFLGERLEITVIAYDKDSEHWVLKPSKLPTLQQPIQEQ